MPMSHPVHFYGGLHTQISLRLFFKLLRASFRAEEIRLPLKLHGRRRFFRLNIHPANWIPLHISPVSAVLMPINKKACFSILCIQFSSFFSLPSVLFTLRPLCYKNALRLRRIEYYLFHRCCNSINPNNSSYIASFSSFFPLPIAFAAQCRI